MEKVYTNPIGWGLTLFGALGLMSAVYFALKNINQENISQGEIEIDKLVKKIVLEGNSDEKSICCSIYPATKFNSEIEKLILEDMAHKCGKDLKGSESRIFKERGIEYLAICVKVDGYQTQ